tara:strand:+ start:1041 stop:1988 length:948 start_codon:yes stop_codon:yes gene_type:complete
MAYIGREPQIGNFQVCDAISVVNGQAAYTMQVASTNVVPETANHCLVSLNGILQKPGSSFTVSSSTLTFASNLVTNDVIDFVVILGSVLDLGTPSDSTVTTAKLAADAVTEAKIADNAVESEHLNNNIVSGLTALGATPADTDEFLVSDAGTIKRVDYSYIKGGGITQADQFRLSAAQVGDADPISSNIERVDTDGFSTLGDGMSVSSGTFTFPETGYYFIQFNGLTYGQATHGHNMRIMTTTDNSSYNEAALAQSMHQASGYHQFSNQCNFIFDVTNTSTHKVQFKCDSGSGFQLFGNTNSNHTYFTFIRLGDT